MRRILLIIGVLGVTYCAIAQSQPATSHGLEELRRKSLEESAQQAAKVRAFASENNVPISYFDRNGNLVVLVGIDEANTPRYVTVDNAGAAITTGVTKLREGGGLGLNLEGEGMIVGVWDGGSLNEHVEFGTRILQSEGAGLSDHAVHVTGTIAASGVNAAAKGMAPKAQVRSWDFGNDMPEMLGMAKPDQTTLLMSNHSYGLITGWRFEGSWQWFGNATISPNEDYRFGFYSSTTKSWDDLAYNAPYYTLMKSAGNDRSDVGNGSRPPDCNGGSGFDCIGDVGTAKNIITVGAVVKVPEYTGPGSVQMSSFSSWGPTDDGRIKPDFVAAGVNLLSSFSGSATAYGTLSGTSMATPNATGSLLLIQELYKKVNNSFMRSATLKALAIHTVKETGLNPGPDYRFGWGLLDVEAAAKVILTEDNSNVFISEEVLTNNGVFELDLLPIPGTKITATLVWTDPSGNPVSPTLDPTDKMLVNDLDLRIVDEANQQFFPWILNPAEPNQEATKADNSLDNVEKLEFDNPQARPYTLRVTHKGQLQNGPQAFSLIITYTSNNDPSIAYYWVGGSGTWSDPAHWSLSSGGSSAGTVPTISDRVFFDENSFSGPGAVTFSGNAAASSILWFATENISWALNGHTLEIDGSFTVSSPNLTSQGAGTFSFVSNSTTQNLISFSNNSFEDILFEFNGDSRWRLGGMGQIGEFSLVKGEIDLRDQPLTTSVLTVNSSSPKILNISGSSISNLEEMNMSDNNLNLTSGGSTITVSSSEAQIVLSGITFDGNLVLNGSGIEFSGSNNEIAQLTLGGEVTILGNNEITNLQAEAGTEITLGSGSEQLLYTNTTLSSTAGSPITITSNGAQNATLSFDGHFKLCFDNLIIDGVDATGEGVVSVGANSQVTDSDNWFTESCNEILFADFTYTGNCVKSLVQFTDVSTGDVESWEWDFGDPDSDEDVSALENPTYIYQTEGTYSVSLTITEDGNTRSYTQDITIGPNSLPDNHIVLSNGRLVSFQLASTYQWYKNGEVIAGATSRTYDFQNQQGIFIVVIQNTGCNKASEPYINIITGTEQPVFDKNTFVYPNPTDGVLNIEVPFNGNYRIRMYDTFGRMVNESSHSDSKVSLSMSANKSGMYLLQIVKDNFIITRKVILSAAR